MFSVEARLQLALILPAHFKKCFGLSLVRQKKELHLADHQKYVIDIPVMELQKYLLFSLTHQIIEHLLYEENVL